ncbi:hypothetical protein D3C76_1494440 [compost metagenome]
MLYKTQVAAVTPSAAFARYRVMEFGSSHAIGQATIGSPSAIWIKILRLFTTSEMIPSGKRIINVARPLAPMMMPITCGSMP